MSDPTHGPRKLNQWLSRGGFGAGAKLLAQAGRLARLNRALEQALPAKLRGHWQLAQVHPEALVLVAESPAWASQLRFWHNTLLETVERDAGFRPRSVQVRGNAYKPQPRRPKHSPRSMSMDTATMIANTAAYTDDEALQRALQRLARAGVAKKPQG